MANTLNLDSWNAKLITLQIWVNSELGNQSSALHAYSIETGTLSINQPIDKPCHQSSVLDGNVHQCTSNVHNVYHHNWPAKINDCRCRVTNQAMFY